MHIILDKPSLSFKKNPTELPGKQIIVYTNELERVSKTGLAKHLIANNKLSSFDLKFSVNAMNNLQKWQFEQQIYFKTSPIKTNLIIDLLLEKDEILLGYKVEYPIILEFSTAKLNQTIHSLTKTLSFKNDFQILCKIGEGSFAEIFLARQTATQYLRSIKIIDKERCIKLGELSFIKNQFDVLKQIQSDWHIQLFYAFQDEKNVYFVTQFCPYGDLYNQITQNFKQINITTKYAYFIQICLEICRLHQKGYIYRDLKPENVLIDFRGNAKLCDFGYAIKSKPDELRFQICGSYEYIPPEMASKKGYNHSYDLYCLGLLFYEMLAGENPFKGITSKNLQQISSRKISFQIQGITPSTKDLLKKLLEKDPKKRIGYDSSAQIFKHPFFMQNGQLIVKILKNEKIQAKQIQNIKVKNIGRRKQHFQEQYHSKTKIKKIPIVFEGKVYNSLTPQFDVVQKMGPKMVPTDDKNMKQHNDSNI